MSLKTTAGLETYTIVFNGKMSFQCSPAGWRRSETACRGRGSSRSGPAGATRWLCRGSSPSGERSWSTDGPGRRFRIPPHLLPAETTETFGQSWDHHATLQPTTNLIQLIQIQNLPLYMRNLQGTSLQIPKFSNLVQEVELDSSLCLKGRNPK